MNLTKMSALLALSSCNTTVYEVSQTLSTTSPPSATLVASEEEEREEKEDQREISATEGRIPVADSIFDVFLSPFSEDIAQL